MTNVPAADAGEHGLTASLVSGGASCVPQVGQCLQTEPISPPAAIQSVVGPYTSIVSSESTSEGTAYGADAPAREATRQAAIRKEQEEAEARWREQQYTPPGTAPAPTEGGAEGSGEETFGDPVHCYVGGDMSQSNGKTIIDGYGGCNQGLPAGSGLKVCVEDRSEFGPNFVKCHQVVVNHTSRYWSLGLAASVSCSGSNLYRSHVAFYVPGGRTLYAIKGDEECGSPYTEDIETVSETVFEEFIGTWDDPYAVSGH